jgi:hypothetical protein
VIKEAKNLLEKIIKEKIHGVTVVRSAADESHEIMARKFPLVALVTNPGTFDGKEARTVRYFEGEPKQYRERYVRGERVLPILVRCWAAGEDDADGIFSRILPAIPSQWVYDGFVKHIEIGWEEHSDHVKNVTKTYLSVAEVRFRAAAAMEPGEIPYYTQTVLEEGEIINQEG